jgi:hypothetical protein
MNTYYKPNRNRVWCPLCQADNGFHKTPDCAIYPDGNGFCFRCGTYIQSKLLASKEHDHPRKTPPPPQATHVDVPILTNEQRAEILEYMLGIVCTADKTADGRAYLASRGILPETICSAAIRLFEPDTWRALIKHMSYKYGMGALIAVGLVQICADGIPRDIYFSWYKAGQSFLLFPYFVDRRVVFLKGRLLLEKSEAERLCLPRYLNSRGRTPLYDLDALQRPTGTCYISEGEIDTLTLKQAGYCAVGVSGALSFKRDWCCLFAGRRVYLALDGDEAGAAGTRHIGTLFASAGLPPPYILPIPQGHDINSLCA